jgi:hypothetical protein
MLPSPRHFAVAYLRESFSQIQIRIQPARTAISPQRQGLIALSQGQIPEQSLQARLCLR